MGWAKDEELAISGKQKRKKITKRRKKPCVIKTTNKTRDRRNIKWRIYNGYILGTKVRVRFLECYKVSCQVGALVWVLFLSSIHCALSLSFFLPLFLFLTQSEHILHFIGIYSTVLCALYPKSGLVPEASQSHSWNPFTIKPRDGRRRERKSLPLSSTDNQLCLQPSYKHSIEPPIIRYTANELVNPHFPKVHGEGCISAITS